MNYAIAFPRRVSALILLNSGPVRQALVGAMNDNIFLRLTPEQTQAAKDHPSLETLMAGYFFDREKAKAFTAQFKPESFHMDVAQFMAADEMAPGMDLRPVLKQLTMPALVIAGRQDPLDPGMQYEIHLALQNSQLVLLDRCGHFAWMEQPDALFSALKPFLAAHQ